jgi:methionine-gamma-lyase
MVLFEENWNPFKGEYLVTSASFDERKQFEQRIIAGESLPLEQRVAFPFTEVGQLGRILDGEQGQFYARAGSLAETALRRRLVEAEAGYLREKAINPHEYVAASVFPSGMNAIATILENVVERIPRIVRGGMRFVCGKTLYHNTKNVFSMIERKYNIAKTAVVDTTNLAEVKRVLRESQGNIIAIFYETVTNPLIEYTDTRAIYNLVHYQNIPIIVDNTFLTPYLQQPMRMGADIVIHSMTKYCSGAGNYLAGAAIGPKKFIEDIRDMQIDSGNVFQSPEIAQFFYSQLLLLPERMEQHVRNAREIAAALQGTRMQKHKIERVFYPTIQDTRYYSAGGVLSFMLKGKDDKEKRYREARLMQFCIGRSYPYDRIIYAVGFGDKQYRIFGESTWGDVHGIDEQNTAGLIRLATGILPTRHVIDFLRDALNNAYQLKQYRRS